jgi:hypothetical protein
VPERSGDGSRPARGRQATDSDDGQAQETRERRRDAKESNTDRRAAGDVALQALGPAQAPVGTLRAGESWLGRRGGRRRQGTKQDRLSAEQGQPVPAKAGPGPIAPQERETSWCGSRFKQGWRGLGRERPEHRTHAPGLAGVGAIALTVGAEVTGPTVGNSGSIQHAQAALAFRATFLGIQGMVSRATQGAIPLRLESLARKATPLSRARPLRRPIGDRRRGR